jgi:hypothetical protein
MWSVGVKELSSPIAAGTPGAATRERRAFATGDHAAAAPTTGASAPTPTIGTVGDAMRRVLQAESDAAQKLAECQVECQAALDAARLDARRIAERAEAIAQAIHGRIDRVASERAECRRQTSAHAPAEPDEARVAAAILHLAARLTGARQ